MKGIFAILTLSFILGMAPELIAHHGGRLGQSSGSDSGGHGGSGSHQTASRPSQGHQGTSNRQQRANKAAYKRSKTDIYNGRLRTDLETTRFGPGHSYSGRDFHWYGRSFHRGSRFLIGGFWFTVVGPWPDYFSPFCHYYIDYDEFLGAYFLYCPDSLQGDRVLITVGI